MSEDTPVQAPDEESGDSPEPSGESGSPDAQPRAGDDTESPEQVIEYAREDAIDFLEGLLESVGLPGRVEAQVIDGEISALVEGEDLGVLIGRHGRTLEAVQELLRAAVQHQAETHIQVELDIEGYRVRRREAVETHAREMANRALETGEVRLRPMPAFERKVVHEVVGQMEGLQTFSEGEDPRRYVVIRADAFDTEEDRVDPGEGEDPGPEPNEER